MAKDSEELQNVLSVELNKNFIPAEPTYKEKLNNFPETMMYWIVGNDGKEKTYLEATPKEILDWSEKIFPRDIPSKYRKLLDEFDEENLVLENYKAYYLGTVLKAISESSMYCLFGKQQDWDKIEEWVRLQQQEAKLNKDNK